MTAMSLTLSTSICLGVSAQKTNLVPEPDKDGVYVGWNGVRVASLIRAAPAVLDDPEMKGSKHVSALLVVVGADGVIKTVAVANKVASRFDDSAIAAVTQSQFEPGRLNGNPVATRFLVWVPFLGDGQPGVPVGGAWPGKKPDGLKTLITPAPTYTPEAEFPSEARSARLKGEGMVVFEVLVDEDGLVKNASLLASTDKGLDQNAYAALSKYKFKPALLQGVRVPFLMTIVVNFQMR